VLFTFLITRLRDSHFSDFHRHVPYRSLSLNSEMSRICPTFYYLGSPARIFVLVSTLDTIRPTR
jgi:hypothetical protein